ncbi:MAG: hypothetical protein KA140_07060 [Caldisericia bacterium]|nr:hypothetical protein [Caldisericia bacterium]
MDNEYTFYMFLLTYVLLLMVAVPLVAGFLFRKTHLWNGIAAMISMVLTMPALLLSPGIQINNYLYASMKFLWMVFACWTLIFSIFGLLEDKHKIVSVIAISVLSGIFALIAMFAW